MTEEEIKIYTKIYIPTRLEQENDVFRNKKFINKCILCSTKQYHLILGDTGAGKSSFLINSYFYLVGKIFKKGYSIYYYSLRDNNVFNAISNIDNKTSAVLFLDAFDESLGVGADAKAILGQIESTTKEFAKIVITSRKHFFDTEEEEPNNLSINRAIAIDRDKYQKYQILPFSNIDVSKYLLKKYGIKLNKFFKAKNVVKKSKDVMSRPLLLSYIEELLNAQNNYSYSYEIYDVILSNCIKREIKYIDMMLEEKNTQNQIDILLYEKTLREAYEEIAIIMYNNFQKSGMICIEKENIDKLEIFNSEFFKANPKRVRSLLERNNDNTFSFSHRSVFEYLISLNFDKINDFRFDRNLSQTYIFLLERYISKDEKVKELVIDSPENWYDNIRLFDLRGAKIQYTHRDQDGIILEFKYYDKAFIVSTIKNMCDSLKDQQKHLHKYKNKYSIMRISKIVCLIQSNIKLECISELFGDIGKTNQIKPDITYSDQECFTKIQIIGEYEYI